MSTFEARSSVASAPMRPHQRQGYRHLLAAQQVAGLQDEMGHVVVGRVDDEPVHPTRVADGRSGVHAAAHFDLALGQAQLHDRHPRRCGVPVGPVQRAQRVALVQVGFAPRRRGCRRRVDEPAGSPGSEAFREG